MGAIVARQPWAKEKADGFTVGLFSGGVESDCDQSQVLDWIQGAILRSYQGRSIFPKRIKPILDV